MSRRLVRSGKKTYRTTFTYFIPAPPQRKTGYREIEFDKIMRGILETGFELESFHTETVASGIFLIGVLKTQNKKIFDSDIEQNLHDNFKLSHTHSSPEIVLDEEEDA